MQQPDPVDVHGLTQEVHREIQQCRLSFVSCSLEDGNETNFQDAMGLLNLTTTPQEGKLGDGT
jgi:hypothetical protein